MLERRADDAVRQMKSVGLHSARKSAMPLCWLPKVIRVFTGGLLQRWTYPRRNWPPWEKPMALKPDESSGIVESCEQTVAICSSTRPKKVAERSASESSSR